MGAYYNHQIAYPINGKVNNSDIFRLDPSNFNKRFREFFGYKFAEHCYFANPIMQAIYKTLELTTNKDHQAVVSTVCDYDKKGTFKYSRSFDSGEVNLECRLAKAQGLDVNDVNFAIWDWVKRYNKVDDKDFLNAILKSGFVVCDETKQIISLAYFQNIWGDKGLVFDPIALLTRSQKNGQDGGDFGADDLEYSPYNKYTDFDKNLITAWKDKAIYFATDENTMTYAFDEYTDISAKLLMRER